MVMPLFTFLGERLSVETIIDYVQNQYIEPARRRSEKQITIRAGDVHDEMKLVNRQPLVCETLRSSKLQNQCNVKLVNERWGRNVHQHHARNIWYMYEIL